MTVNEPALMTGSVMTNRELAAGIFQISFRLPDAFPTPTPGQFVMLKVMDGRDPLLRRPLSIHAFTRVKDGVILEIIYKAVGRGTRLLSSLLIDAAVSIMGPLGQGFTFINERKKIIIIAGGMGIAPLSFLVQQYLDVIQRGASHGGLERRVVCYIGAATADYLVGLNKIDAYCDDVRVSTDDGSCGYHGNVIELFCRDMAFYSPDETAVYACGPTIMLKELDRILADQDFFCQVSLEERMACGLGACLG